LSGYVTVPLQQSNPVDTLSAKLVWRCRYTTGPQTAPSLVRAEHSCPAAAVRQPGYLPATRPLGFAPPPHDGFALLASATRMRLPAGTFPMLAMNAPYTESQSYAIPLGEDFPKKEWCLRMALAHMWFHREDGPPSPSLGNKCAREHEPLPDQNSQEQMHLT